MATITPFGGTALTNSAGVASVTLAPASVTSAGAAMITAVAQVSTSSVTGSTGYSIGASTLTMSALTLGAGSTPAAALSAFGTTSVTVTVTSGGVAITAPQVVTFSSTCAGSGKAVLTSSVTTVNGVATASYRDNGCAGTDLITASVGSLTAAQSATIYITAPIAGSIQFVSATPASISLAGTGGVSTSQVTFKVMDGGGNPISGKIVTFNLSTTAGGITLTPSAPAQATSDNSGLVYINVNAGKVSTPVRVTATTPGIGTTILSTQSNQLTITTGIPTQSSFSLAATTFNIEGWNIDGVTSTLTVRMADHFGNYPPDGSAINFYSEGGRVGGSCVTVIGDCAVTFNSQNIRPTDGRVTVLAYAVGEESFVDLNANGVADKAPANELIVNGVSTDMPEAWVDYNEDGKYQAATEPFIDFNADGVYNTADGLYNGVLCDNTTAPPVGSSVGTCSANKSIHVRGDIVIVLSGSYPSVTTSAPATVNLLGCGAPQTFGVRISDINNNHMPAGTTVTFAASGDGTLVGATSFVVPNTSAVVPLVVSPPPAAAVPFYNYSISIQGDGTLSTSAGVTTCTDPTASGILTVTTKTPSGITTTTTLANLIN
jgi:hypothetical protein